MPALVPVRKQGQKNKGERIKIESILYVQTDLKITKPKEIFQLPVQTFLYKFPTRG